LSFGTACTARHKPPKNSRSHGLSLLNRLAPWLIDFANRFSRNGRRRRLELVRLERERVERGEIRKAG
ncbi:MAG: hypothetical protein ACKPHU_01975, partial [Planctomycetaceae bacterium]